MAGPGTILKRCGCLDKATGQRSGQRCARLRERGHGSWYFDCFAPNLLGRAERFRRGGYASRAAAMRGRDDMLALTREQLTAQHWSVQQCLEHWLAGRTRIRPTTRANYSHDVHRFLIPHLGALTLADLTSRLLTATFAEIRRTPNRFGEPHSPSTLHHIRTTLRAALSAAVREGIITDNPARRIELPTMQATHALVWTDARVAAWKETGEHPTVAVWTAPQLAAFLDFAVTDGLYALWWLIALRGLRRGEAAGLRWADVDLDNGHLEITQQRTTAGYEIYEGEPKSSTSRRYVALDPYTVQVLRQHRQRQQRQKTRRAERNRTYLDSGYVFTRPDGAPFHPGYFTQRLHLLIKKSGLPPVRLHDLRHCAATLAHAAGADLKTIQDQLGHSTIVITADTYTSVLPDVQRASAENTAHLVIAAARKTTADIKRRAQHEHRTAKKAETPSQTGPGATAVSAAQSSSGKKRRSRRVTASKRHTRGTLRPHKNR